MTQRPWLLFLGLMLVVTVLALPILNYPPGRDQGEFATIAAGILDGKIPYVDLWNPKPPAVFYVYALAIQNFGHTTAALRVIDLLLVPLIAAALFWLGKRLENLRTAAFAALIFAAFYYSETFWTLTQNDGIALLPMTLAIVLLFVSIAERKNILGTLAVFGAGAMIGLSIWFKYPFAVQGLVLVLGYLLLSRRLETPLRPIKLIESAAFFALGGLLVTAAGLLYLTSIGAVPELILSAQLTSQYTALTFNLAEFLPLLQTALGFRWQHWGLLWILAALWLFVGRRGAKRGWGVILLWLLGGLLIMLVQAKAYDYHWLPMLPPLALLAASAVDHLIHEAAERRLSRRNQVSTTILTGLIFLAIIWQSIWPLSLPYLQGEEDQFAYYSRFQAGEFNAEESLAVAEVLRERVLPGDSLFIWGFRPEVYYMTGLKPATRFIFQFPLVADWYPSHWRQENVDVLWAALPPYVLVLQVDYMPFVTGRDEDSHTLLNEYNELSDWLNFNYDREIQIGNFFLWRRKT